MKSVVAASLFASAQAGGNVNLSFEDCGDASTVGTITDLQPRSLTLGGTTTIVGSGTLKQDVPAGEFSFTAKALGVTVLSDGGDLCADKDIKLPLGVGSFNYKSAGCPVKAGDVTLTFDATLAGSIPSQIAKLDISVAAKASDGTKALCATIHTSPGQTWQELVEEVNSKQSSWVAAVPEKFGNVEEVPSFLGAFVPGDEHYDEPEVRDMDSSNAAIPTDFDAREQWPSCTGMAEVKDQSACGSCWAFGSADSFQDRACVATGKDVRYSADDTAFCSNAGFGCSGGNSAWNWFQSHGVVTGGLYEDTKFCRPYSFAPCAHHVPATAKYPACPSGEYTGSCTRSCIDEYSGSYNSDALHASSAYSVRGVQNIQNELMTKGPLYVAFTVYSDFPTYKSGVYKHTSGSQLGGHAVEVMGWGEMNGEAYWLVKNSWNEQWGDGGFFKIARGINECGIESSVSAGEIAADATV